jgi:cytosine/adenosine deaminase-related metal-dependent hydrolase
LRGLGIAVGIGVDGPASNDSQDMLQAIKTTVLLQRVKRLQATAFSAAEAFEMATIGGARSLRLEDQFGSLEPGKAADLVVFDGDAAALAGAHDPLGAVVFVAGPTEVRDVWVAGTRSVEGGRMVNVDEAEVAARARPIAHRIATAAGLVGPGTAPAPPGGTT